VEVPRLSPAERAVLLGPDLVARTAARQVRAAEQRWLLRQPRGVRRSFVEDVIDADGDPNAAERWMLGQAEAVRSSYVADVLDAER
jgi:nuclear transport factor 2 (NTF2) superfamily protein